MFPKKMKRRALYGALTDKYQSGKIIIVAGLDKIATKTKELTQVLGKLNLIKEKHKLESKVLLVT
ncbi:50S ribosomal protein L4, partial [Candidatus Gottesmanbacteria bacterium RBG_13_37_7]